MRYMGAVLLLLVMALPLLVSGQQTGSRKLPLAITDKQAVQEWSKAIYDGPIDPKVEGDTPLLLSLSDTEWVGRFRFRQRCALCHAPQAGGETTWGPVLTQKNVIGREDIVRRQIVEGSNRMPAFKYSNLDAASIDAIIAYLKKVEKTP